jgi:hypothetical protein
VGVLRPRWDHEEKAEVGVAQWLFEMDSESPLNPLLYKVQAQAVVVTEMSRKCFLHDKVCVDSSGKVYC